MRDIQVRVPVRFRSIGTIQRISVDSALDFAWEMSYGAGNHKIVRSGGTHQRSSIEVFLDVFSGKLGEFALCQVLRSERGIDTSPGLDVEGFGYWEDIDFRIGDKIVEVKTTKHFGNLLLLETSNWNLDGSYRHPHSSSSIRPSAMALVRLRWPVITKEVERQAYPKNRDALANLVRAHEWEFDIPGFLIEPHFNQILTPSRIFAKGSRIGRSSVHLDAENYVIEASELAPLQTFLDYVIPAKRSSLKKVFPQHQGKRWSRELDKELIELFTRGEPIGFIAERFSRSPGAIRWRIYKLCIEPRRGEKPPIRSDFDESSTPGQFGEFVRTCASGLDFDSALKKLGISKELSEQEMLRARLTASFVGTFLD